jgi:hypothetical protein
MNSKEEDESWRVLENIHTCTQTGRNRNLNSQMKTHKTCIQGKTQFSKNMKIYASPKIHIDCYTPI